MTSSQASNLLAFPGPQSGKHLLTNEQTLEAFRLSPAEVNQQLRNQLQTTLDVGELLQIFFVACQRLLQFQGLSFHNTTQQLSLTCGQNSGDFRIDYQLELEGELLGLLSVHHAQVLDEHALVNLESLTPSLIFPLRNALKYHAVLHASLHDPLTGLRNRTGMHELLERDLHSAQRTGSPLSVLMIDIDHFKTINDRHGHAGGDTALIAVARLLKENLRAVDAIFRFGGEEFLVVLPHTDQPYLVQIADRLRKSVAGQVVVHEGQHIRLSLSFGAAIAKKDESPQHLLQRADSALYAAKTSGRNRVCLAD